MPKVKSFVHGKEHQPKWRETKRYQSIAVKPKEKKSKIELLSLLLSAQQKSQEKQLKLLKKEIVEQAEQKHKIENMKAILQERDSQLIAKGIEIKRLKLHAAEMASLHLANQKKISEQGEQMQYFLKRLDKLRCATQKKQPYRVETRNNSLSNK